MSAPDEETFSDEEDAVYIEEEEIGEVVEVDENQAPEEMFEQAEEDNEHDDDDEADIEDDASVVYSKHTDSIYCVSLNKVIPDLAMSGGGDDKAYLWKVSTGETLFEFTGHTDSITSVKFNYDGTLAATASLDGSVKIWSSSDGHLIQTLSGPTEGINWIDWHQKGNVLLAGSEDCTSWLWSVPSGKCMSVFGGHSSSVTCGYFTSNDKNVITGSNDATVRVWDPKTANSLFVFKGNMFHQGGITSLSGSKRDWFLSLSGSEDSTAKLLNVENGKILGSLLGHSASIETSAFANSHPWAATGSMDETIRVWDLNTLQSRCSLRHHGGVVKVEWQATESLLFSCSVDREISLWDCRNGSLVRSFRGHTNVVLDFDMLPNGTLISGSDDHTVRVFKL